MVPCTNTLSMTFFLVTDVVRATDRSAEPTWTEPGSSLSATAAISWAPPAKKAAR